MKKTLFLLTLCSLLLAASCNSDDDATPDTSNDHRIVRCKVNGEDWIPLNDGSGGIFSPTGPPYDLQYYSDTKRMGLRAGREIPSQLVDEGFNIDCYLSELNKNNPLLIIGEQFANLSNPDGCNFYIVDTSNLNYINVTFIDTIDYVMIGEFEFSAINDCQDTVHITDGYFDLHYRF